MKKQTDVEIGERRIRILEAASKMFFRYGYSRTTLGDIAHEAKLHRPALYSVFPDGKDELFEAVLLRLVEREIESYRKEISKLKTVKRRLFFCVEHWSMGGFRLTDTYPDARDAFNIAYPAVRKMYEVLTSFYAELLREVVVVSPLNLSAEQVARLLIFSLRGIKDLATDAESMHALLVQEVDLFFTAISAPRSSSSQ